jgi:hypothetical protein
MVLRPFVTRQVLIYPKVIFSSSYLLVRTVQNQSLGTYTDDVVSRAAISSLRTVRLMDAVAHE